MFQDIDILNRQEINHAVAMALGYTYEPDTFDGDVYWDGTKCIKDFSPVSTEIGEQIINDSGIIVVRGNDLYFPKGNEFGDYYEPLWIASLNGEYRSHGQSFKIAGLKCFLKSKFGTHVDVPRKLSTW